MTILLVDNFPGVPKHIKKHSHDIIKNHVPAHRVYNSINRLKMEKFSYGAITTTKDLKQNHVINCIPESIMEMEFENYDSFLSERRKLMTEKIKEYYFSLYKADYDNRTFLRKQLYSFLPTTLLLRTKLSLL
jgi:hypothetical protein